MPIQAKVFYSVIYSSYAAIGLIIGLVLNRFLSVNRRLRVLIVLYWILIAATIIEGIYFGVMIGKNKAKFITSCTEGSSSSSPPLHSPIAGNNTIIPVSGDGARPVHKVDCRKTGLMIGAIYIAGPGAWVILHVTWIFMIVLYAKALRRNHATDEETGPMKMVPLTNAGGHRNGFNKPEFSRSVGKQPLDNNNKKSAAFANVDSASGFHSYQSHPFQNDNNLRHSSSGGLGAMFRNVRPWSSSSNNSSTAQDMGNSMALHVIDEDDDISLEDHGRSRTRSRQGRNSNPSIAITMADGNNPTNGHDSEESSDEDNENITTSNRLTRLGTSSTDGSLSSKSDIPADGKGWWIRQIEGKRRGEICPCTLDSRDSRYFNPCWCGKERRINSSQSQGSLSATAQASGSSSTSIVPDRSQL
ncbi:hypothetical protein FBU30_009635 [Linnemannia zychae]|nr:hypothetical protein FBU30_009635 [Linnemannia zychae]